MKLVRFAAAIVTAVLLAGCGWWGGDEATVESVSVAGVPLSVSIDPDARTVVVSAPPIDLSAVTVGVTVTEGGTTSGLQSFEDGIPQTLTVTSANGGTEEWSLTINLREGISFRTDGDWVFLEAGLTDSNDPEAAALLRNGKPFGSYEAGEGSYFDMLAAAQVIDLDDPDLETARFLIGLSFDGAPPARLGAYELGSDFDYVDLYLTEWIELTDGSLSLVQAPNGEGQIARATFAFSGPNAALTQGYLKLVQIADDGFDVFEELLPGGGGGE